VAQVPLQDNGYDCAVYAVQNVEEVVTRWPSITQKDVDARAVPGFNRDMFTPRQMKV
jgi:Ulp1 family protease